MLDFAIIVVVLLCVLRGYLRGVLKDLLGLAALVVAYVVSAPFGSSVGQLLAQHSGMSASAAYTAARVAAGVVIFVSLKISAHVADARFGKDETGVTVSWNRNLGALVGLTFGLMAALIVLFLADSLCKAFPASQNALVRAAGRSHLRRWVSAYNPADRFLVTDLLRLLSVAHDKPEVLDRLKEDPRVEQLLETPTLERALKDEDLIEAVRNREFGKVAENDNLKALLGDADLMRHIFSPELRAAIRQVIEEAGQEADQEEDAGD